MFADQPKKRKKSTKKKVVLRDYQKTCLNRIKKRKKHGLFLKPGLGKTLVALKAYEDLHKKGKVDRMIIVANLRIAVSTWPKEIAKWGMKFNYSILHGPKKSRLLNDEDTDVFIINYEGLPWLVEAIKKQKTTRQYDMIVIDECSKIKNTKSKRFKMIKKLVLLFEYVVPMTGTPAPNHLKDLYGQIYVLDKGESLGKYITHFLTKYFYPSGYMGYEWKPYEGAWEKIMKAIAHLVSSFGYEKVKMPEKIESDRMVDINEEAMEVYREMEKEFIVQLQEDDVMAVSSAGLSNKLRQITGGNVYGENKKVYHIHNDKIEELKEIVEELQGSPLLVGYEFNHELEQLLKEFPEAEYIGRGVSAKQSSIIEDRWNRGEIPLLFGQHSAIAHGLNFQEGPGCTVLFYCVPWDLELYEQEVDRVWRSGNKNEVVTVIHLLATGTVDEAVMRAIRKKDFTQKALLECLKSYYGV